VFEVERYTVEVERLLAAGGFANVYLARDINSEKRYALKKVSPSDKRCAVVVLLNHAMLGGCALLRSTFASSQVFHRAPLPASPAAVLLLPQLHDTSIILLQVLFSILMRVSARISLHPAHPPRAPALHLVRCCV
jgi:serine/threonine protein kinase